jgi:hypothetical protein
MGRRTISSIAAMPVANSANLKEESNVKYVGICRKKRIVLYYQSLKSDKITLAEEVDSDITDRNSSVDFESD